MYLAEWTPWEFLEEPIYILPIGVFISLILLAKKKLFKVTHKQVPNQTQRLYQCNQIQTIYYAYVWIGWRLPLLREFSVMCLVICWRHA